MKCYLGLETRNSMNQAILQLDTGNGEIIDDEIIQKVLMNIGQYYMRVYLYVSREWKAHQSQYQDFFDQDNFKQITQELK